MFAPKGSLEWYHGLARGAPCWTALAERPPVEDRMKIGEIIVKRGYADAASIEKALSVQKSIGKQIGEILVERGILSETDLQEALAFQRDIGKAFENKAVFLRSAIPFDSLGLKAVEEIAGTMNWESFPPGELIIRQGAQGSKFYLIKSGLVKVFLVEEARETVVGFLGEGDCFGEISLLTNGPATANIQTMVDTVCLVQRREKFLEMTQRYPLFYQFFNQLLTQRLRAVYRELLSENPGIGQVEPYLYRKQVKDLVSASEPFCDPQSTIEDAARRIIEKGLSKVIIVTQEKKPTGVLGLKEIVRSVFLGGVSPRQTVETIMAKSFQTIDTNSYFFDALHEMVKNKASELIVLEDGKARGLLTGFDLLRFRGREVLYLLRNIESAPSVSQLNLMRKEVEKVLRALISDGALASQACKIVSEFNDKMVRRVIRLVEEELGSPPAPYVWLGLGSEGRREQTLLTDQDNAIAFYESSSEKTVDYFRELSNKVVQGLHGCGFPLCKGGVMANQPKWFGDLNEWKEKSTQWITGHALQEENASDIYTFLDFRSIHGDPGLEKELKSTIAELVRTNPAFLRNLAQNVVDIPVPLGFFKNFAVERSGQYKNTINLKISGIVPLITCIKLLALSQGIGETNTLERIKGLLRSKIISSDQGEFLEQAFETFLTLKIRNNLQEMEKGKGFESHIDPAGLSTRQKQLLKEAFLAVSQLQKTTRSILRVESHEFGVFR